MCHSIAGPLMLGEYKLVARDPLRADELPISSAQLSFGRSLRWRNSSDADTERGGIAPGLYW